MKELFLTPNGFICITKKVSFSTITDGQYLINFYRVYNVDDCFVGYTVVINSMIGKKREVFMNFYSIFELLAYFYSKRPIKKDTSSDIDLHDYEIPFTDGKE